MTVESEGAGATAGGLVGRGPELATLTALLETPGHGACVLVEGEAGIGKTRLADAVAAAARARGYLVLRGVAREFDRRRPFAVLAEALGLSGAVRSGPAGGVGPTGNPRAPGGAGPSGTSTAPAAAAPAPPGATEREIAALLAGGRARGADEDLPAAWPAMESRIGELVLALLDERSTEQPVLLVVEDLHWADAATLALLHGLAQACGRTPLVVLGTARPLPRRPELAALLERGAAQGAVRLSLAPLTSGESAELAAALLRRPVGPALQRRLEAAGGNPLFVIETLAALQAEGALVTDEAGHADAPGQRVPSSLVHTIRERLRFLSDATLHTLGLASVLGVRFRPADLARLAGRPVGWCWERLGEAVEAGVLVDSDEWLAFRHELFRDSLYLELPAAVRTALHDDAARLLHEAGAAASEVAEHVLRGSPHGDRMAVGWLREAAAQAALQSPSVAVELLEGCLRLTPAADPERAAIQHELAAVLVTAGRPAACEAVCREALAGPLRAVDGARLRATLAHALLDQGRMAEAEVEAAAVLGVADVLSPVHRVRFLGWWSLLRLLIGDVAGAASAAGHAAREAARVGDRPALISAQLTQAHVARYEGRLEEADRLAATASTAAEEDASVPAHAQTPHLVHALVLIDRDRLTEAGHVIGRGRRAAEALGTASRLVLAQFTETGRLYALGLWDDAVATLESVWPLAQETGLDYQVDTLLHRALIAAHRGEGGEAREWSQRAEAAMAAGVPPYRPGWVGWARSMLAEAAGDTGAAHSILESAWQLCQAAGMACDQRFLGPSLARLRGDGPAAEVVAALEAQARANPDVPGLRAAALRARGFADRDPAHHLAALAVLRDGPRPHELARCAEETALALAGHDRRDEALAVAAEALEGYGALGADGDLSLARSRLRAAGLRLGVRGPRRRPSHGWAALTQTEAKVARLAAQRMSNPEIAQAMFLSRRTVATHVSHVLAKLGMSSRAELVAAAAAGRLEQLDGG